MRAALSGRWIRRVAPVRGLLVTASMALLVSAPVAEAASKAHARKAAAQPPARVKAVIAPVGASRRGTLHAANNVAVRHAVLLTHGRHRGVGLRKVYAVVPERQSIASMQGLRSSQEEALNDVEQELAVKSSVALVMEDGTHDVLFSRNTKVALPIASITKLMTSLVVLESHPAMDEPVTITADDLDTEKFSSSRLAVGTTLSRRDMLHLALMSSENRAAHALARNYPGGLDAAIVAMNAKAHALGMTSAEFHDPTGLTSRNVASAEDLVKLVNAASANATIREFSTDPNYTLPVGRRVMAFHNTNSLVASPSWDIVVQKTGYINEAGKCLVMKAVIEGRSVVIVLLDSFGKFTRLGDANRIRQWMESQPVTDPIARIVKKTS
jgi:D-alanyl-D-alanine endopeptidase (penicillin-binding protein 7)